MNVRSGSPLLIAALALSLAGACEPKQPAVANPSNVTVTPADPSGDGSQGGSQGAENQLANQFQNQEPHTAPALPRRADPPPPSPAAAGSAPAGMRGLLDAHNRYRSLHCAAPLTWSPEIAAVAQRWADSLAAHDCAFEHSRGNYGENLAAGTTGSIGVEDVAAMWYREVDKYDFGSGGFSMETGHFTQLVWQGTTKLGCGTSTCKGMDIWVCNYDPPGNYEGEYQRNVLPKSCRR